MYREPMNRRDSTPKPEAGTADPLADLVGLCRPMIERSSLAMAIAEGTTSILRYVNPAFARLLGRTSEDLIGTRFTETVGEGNDCLAVLNRVYETGEPESYTKPFAEGSNPDSWSYAMWPVLGVDARLLGIVIQVNETTHFQRQLAEMNQALLVAGIRQHELAESAANQNAQMQLEILERKRAEESLRQFVETLEARVAERTAEVQHQADRLRALAGELSRAEQRERKRLARILHDHIQQLLVAARMQLDWIRRDVGRDRVMAAAHGVDEMLREALAASRSLTRDLSPPMLQVSGLVGGLSWLATTMQQQHRLTVQLRLNSKAEPASEEIRFLLFECARELLFNASKHAGTGEAKLTLALAKEGQIRLIVSDKGKGFDLAMLESRQPADLTFGLLSVQERLAYIGGRVEIKTAPGQGTKISLISPIGEADVAPGGVPATSHSDRSKSGTRQKSKVGRVMIVDDHKIMREGLVGLLQFESDIEVVGEAADGPQAIELAAQLEPDVIIMDINLGAMSGIEATRRILDRNPLIAVIGLSMHMDQIVATEMRAAGAKYYLTKGGPSDDLVATIRTCLEVHTV